MEFKYKYEEKDIKQYMSETAFPILIAAIVLYLFTFGLILLDKFGNIGDVSSVATTFFILAVFYNIIYVVIKKTFVKNLVKEFDYCVIAFNAENIEMKEFINDTLTAHVLLSYSKLKKVRETNSFIILQMISITPVLKSAMTAQELEKVFLLLSVKAPHVNIVRKKTKNRWKNKIKIN